MTIVEEGVAFAQKMPLFPLVSHRSLSSTWTEGGGQRLVQLFLLALLCSPQWVELRCKAVSSRIAPPLSKIIGRQSGD